MNIRRILITAMLALTVCSLWAQERTDTTYVFRFVPGRDMFYVPWQGNDKELARLEACIGTYRNRIIGGEIPLHVDGYCNSKESEVANLAVAKTRSNRVKSELITRQKLTEECFVTHNHSGSGDYVTVRLVVPVYDKVKETPADVQEDTTVIADGRQPEAVESAETVAGPSVADTIQTARYRRHSPSLRLRKERQPQSLTLSPSVPTCSVGRPSPPTSASSGVSTAMSVFS